MRTLSLLLAIVLVACSNESPTGGGGGEIQLSALFVSGDSQSGLVGTDLPQEIVVSATNKQSGLPVTNVIINFVVTSGGGSVFAPAVLVDANGQAKNRWRVGTVAGGQTVEARAVDQNGNLQTYDTAHATALPGSAVAVHRTRFATDIYGNERMVLCPPGFTFCHEGRGTSDNAQVLYWYTDTFNNTTSSCSGPSTPTIINGYPEGLLVSGPFTDENGKQYFVFRNITLGGSGQSAFWVWLTFNCYSVVRDSFVVQLN